MYLEQYYKLYSVNELQNLHTRQLLSLLRNTYKWWDYSLDYETGKVFNQELKIYQSTIKAELATREHIPNKKESKAIRIAHIKQGK